MRKYMAAFALLLAACANQQNLAYQNKQATVTAMNRANSAKVAAGTMRQSEYYAQFYDAMSQPPVGPLDVPAMKNAAHMIDVAKALEAGQITQDQYNSERRSVQVNMQEASQQLQAQIDQQLAANRQAAFSMYLQTRPHTTNCTGTGYSATCTSY